MLNKVLVLYVITAIKEVILEQSVKRLYATSVEKSMITTRRSVRKQQCVLGVEKEVTLLLHVQAKPENASIVATVILSIMATTLALASGGHISLNQLMATDTRCLW